MTTTVVISVTEPSFKRVRVINKYKDDGDKTGGTVTSVDLHAGQCTKTLVHSGVEVIIEEIE